MFSVTIRDHMMIAHSLRGEVFGPAQRLHGATFVVDATFRRADVDADGIVVDIGRAATALHDVLAGLTYRNLDDDPSLSGRNTTTEVLAEVVADRIATRVRDGALGAGFALPDDAVGGCDLVVHTSATSAGLQRALDLLAPEGTVLELSWYGDAEVRLSLGGAFHAGRLAVRASQVGTVSPARSARRTTADRLALALDLLRDPAFDVLVTGESRFDELPGVMARLAAGSLPALCHTITYDGA